MDGSLVIASAVDLLVGVSYQVEPTLAAVYTSTVISPARACHVLLTERESPLHQTKHLGLIRWQGKVTILPRKLTHQHNCRLQNL
jgi:hypothetical protein